MKKKNANIISALAVGAVLFNVNEAAVNAEDYRDAENYNTELEELIKKNNLGLSQIQKKLPVESEDKKPLSVVFNGKYDTLEEAKSRLDEKVSEYENDGYKDIKSEINTIKDEVGHEEFDHYELDVKVDAYIEIEKDEADSIKLDLEKDPKVRVTIKEGKKVLDYVDTLSIQELFDSEEEAMTRLEELEANGYVISQISFTNDIRIDTVTLNETFNSLSEAKAALANFKSKHENVHETDDDIVESRNESGDTLVENSEETSNYFATLEEATSDMNSKIANNESKEYYLTGTVIGPENTGETVEVLNDKIVKKSFIDETQANEYLDSLRSQGYIVKNLVITHDTTIENYPLSVTCNTYEDAQAAIAAFKAQHPSAENENIQTVADSTKDVVENYSMTFESETEADDYKATEEGKTTQDVVYTATKVYNVGETVSTSGVFETRLDAENALTAFTSSHDVIDSQSIVEEAAGTIFEARVITSDQKTYEVGSTTYVIIKKGSDHYIWTEKTLTTAEQNTFIESYKDFNTDNVITYDKLKASHTFISGYNVDNFSSNHKLFTFIQENGITYIKMASGAESRVIYGTFLPVSQYVMRASAHDVSYTVNVNKLTKGYVYIATANASEEVELDSVKLNADVYENVNVQGYKYTTKKHKKAYTYSIVAEGEDKITLASGVLTAKAEKDILKQLYDLDVTTEVEVNNTVYDDDYELVITGVKEEVIENPKTSDNITYSYILMLISFVGMLYISIKSKLFRKKIKNK